jgi:hypothetical protein
MIERGADVAPVPVHSRRSKFFVNLPGGSVEKFTAKHRIRRDPAGIVLI